MNEQTPQVSGRVRLVWIIAIAAAGVYGLGLYALIHGAAPDSGLLLFSFLFGVPIGACILASVIVHRSYPLSIGGHVQLSLAVITGLLLGGVVGLREGAICLFMAAPLYYLAGAIAGLVAGLLLNVRRTPLACIGLLAPLLLWPIDQTVENPTHRGQVVTVMEIDAPPEAVWRHAVAIPEVRPEERVWTFAHHVVGTPRPIDAMLDGSGVGAVRHLRWTEGVTFQEHVTTWEAGRLLAWTFHFAPDSIPAGVERHIRLDGDYLRLEGGDYRLEPLPGGRTRLTLTTRYRFATPVNLYCEWWSQRLFTDFHTAVLSVIKHRAESRSVAALAPSEKRV